MDRDELRKLVGKALVANKINNPTFTDGILDSILSVITSEQYIEYISENIRKKNKQ